MYLEYPAWVKREVVLPDPTEYLLHKTTLQSPKCVADLPNTKKQTQGGYQNEETKKHVPNERTKQKTRKIMKQNADKQSTRYTV